MNLQTTAYIVVISLVPFIIALFAFRLLARFESRGLSYSREASSCFRYVKNSTPPEVFYKVGLLVRIDKSISETDVKKLGSSVSSGSTEGKPPILKVTKNSTGTSSYLNVAFTLKKSVLPTDLPTHTIPGAVLSISFDIQIDDDPISIPPVDIIPIDVEPC